MLEKERAYYMANVPTWQVDHARQFVVIKDDKVLGFYSTEDEALAAGAAAYGLTSFLVRRIGDPIQTIAAPALTLGLISANP